MVAPRRCGEHSTRTGLSFEQNLGVAFHGLNTWHSFQYLAVVIWLNRYRQARAPAASRWQSHLGSRAPARTCAGRKRLLLDTLKAWDTRLPRAPPFSAG